MSHFTSVQRARAIETSRDAMANPADATGTKTFHEDEGAGFWLAALVLALFAAFFYKLREKSAADS